MDALRRIWRFLISPRLALALIFFIGVLCLIGALVIQASSVFTSNPDVYQMWLENIARPKFGAWTGLLSFFGAFDIFHSVWFIGAGSLLMVNILACTVNRWKPVSKMTGETAVRQNPAFFSQGTHTKNILLIKPPKTVETAAAGAFGKHGYRISMEESEGTISLAMVKNRFSPFGTFLTHLSLILFVLGFLMGSLLGFTEPSFVVAEHAVGEVGHDTGLALELIDFRDEYWPDGIPRDYESLVVLYQNDREVRQASVKVNSPLSYRGINFYQSSFGPSVDVKIVSEGTVLYEGPLALTRITGDELPRQFGVVELPQGTKAQFISPSAYGPDPYIGENQLGCVLYSAVGELIDSVLLEPGVATAVDAYEVDYIGMGQYSVFQVTRNPGINLIWIAAGLFIAGLVTVFYFPFRRAWALIEPSEGGKSLMRVPYTGHPTMLSSREMDDIVTEIAQQSRNEVSRG